MLAILSCSERYRRLTLQFTGESLVRWSADILQSEITSDVENWSVVTTFLAAVICIFSFGRSIGTL